MVGAYLDSENRAQLVGFIHDQFAFLDAKARDDAEARLNAAEEEKENQALFELARSLAKQTWTARRALQQYLAGEGCEEEWRLVVAAVSKSTAHIMERFRTGTACVSLDATLAHEESESAFRVQEREEIAEVRRHVHEAIWRDEQKALAPFVKAGEALFEETSQKLDVLRGLAVDTPWIEGEVLGKVTTFEDEFLFAGKELSRERLDEEIAYYQEQKALPAA